MKRIVSIFFVALLGGVGALTIDHFVNKNQTSINAALPANYQVKFANFNGMVPENVSGDFVKASEISLPAVVHVKTEYAPQQQDQFFFSPFGWGQNVPQSRPQMGSGSGVIISGDGYIVTNNHVIDDAQKVEVTLYDHRTYKAKVIGKDPSTDIALLKIDEANLPYLLYGNSDNVKVGEWVLAVGNPFNLTSTVTAGIVSAKARNINILNSDPDRNFFPVESYIQTDAAVNPGNSGGALVNTQGQLVGINAAIASNTGSYTGYSFAVPVNLAKKVVNDLIEFGKVQRAFLGVSIRDIDSKLIEEKKLKSTKGVYVTGISKEGGAHEAGIQEGDQILKIGEVPVENASELQEQISHYRPGDKVSVSLNREGEDKTILVALKDKSGNTMLAKTEKNEVLSILGATFEPITETDMKKLGINSGVKITSLDAGKLRSAGIKEGFIITNIDKKKISSLNDVKLALENKEGGVLIEGIYINGMKSYYAFGL
ncbi:MAG: Do family serine endopeptidase [Bacteroidetes bacterium]|nr:Do family serine endopeptidase [Bacteroidota bacterium]